MVPAATERTIRESKLGAEYKSAVLAATITRGGSDAVTELNLANPTIPSIVAVNRITAISATREIFRMGFLRF